MENFWQWSTGDRNFNSIKVRLELVIFATAYSINMNFNSIKVRLELAFIICLLVIFLYFNSIKVRLEHGGAAHTAFLHEFQFHKGAIRTVLNKRNLCRNTHISIP